MPQVFKEGRVEFRFPDAWKILRPEDTSYYNRHFQNIAGGCKEMDFMLFDPADRVLWLLEVKDYTTDRRTKTECILDEVAKKSRDSLALLYAGAVGDNAQAPSVGHFARNTWRPSRIRVVLHIDQPRKPSKLFPGAPLAANAAQVLRNKVKAVDSHAVVTSCREESLGWTATWKPEPI